MKVVLNGEPCDLPVGATVADALAHEAVEPARIAVAVNGEVVPRGEWATATLAEGDRVEVVGAIQGGAGR